jgi:hypothetical protein
MFPRYRHAPILDLSRKRCPVCNHAVYSPAGVHPQCAVGLHEDPQFALKKSGARQGPLADVAVLAPADQPGLA